MEERAGIPPPILGLPRVQQCLGRISNVKLPCSRGDTAIKVRRIVQRINMSISDRFSTSFSVAVSGVETGINDVVLLLLDSTGNE